jgi:hypothetical protein
MGHGARRNREAVRQRGSVELAEQDAGLRAHDACIRIDVDALHRSQVDHDPAVADG